MMKRVLALLIFSVLIGNFGSATVLPIPKIQIYDPTGSNNVTTPTHTMPNPSAYTITNPTGNQVDILKRGLVTLGVDQHSLISTIDFDLTITVDVTKYSTVGGAGATSSHTLKISYKPNSGLFYKERSVLELDNALKYTFKITSVAYTPVSGPTPPANTLPKNVYVDLELFVDRIDDFQSQVDNTVAITAFNPTAHLLDNDNDNVKDALKVEWTPMTGAEEYEIEWTFINDYTVNNGSYKPAGNILFDFKHNSTRVVTTSLSYDIPLIYPHGYIIYRVRGVGRLKSDPTKRLFSRWSTDDDGYVSPNANHYFLNTHEWEIGMNWQYSSTFAEQGKKKEVVSFFDGTLRNRQMVTLTNSNNRAIVGETIYDNIGRPSIQVLPAPALPTPTAALNGKSLKYYENFNQNSSNQSYNAGDFGYPSTSSCETQAEAMNVSSGASKYYSSNNGLTTGIDAYIPSAGGYPFSQVEYMPDNTGRVKQQGGVGQIFQLGEDHSTKYFYGQASQLELDRMFGSEVGDFSHYQKNMVIDANGQISISYLDQEGRVVATCLAGDVPENMTALGAQASASVELTEEYFLPGTQANALSEDLTSRSFVSSILVSSQSNITIAYGLDILPYTEACLEDEICFGCVYDLTIDFVNSCGESLMPETFTNKLAGHFTMNGTEVIFVDNCTSTNVVNGDKSFVLTNVPIGNYQLVKTLKINEEALEFFSHQYMSPDTNTCFKTLEDFQVEYLENVDLSGCNPDPLDCAQCEEDLGTLANFLANGGTEDDYNYFLAQCHLPCQPFSLGMQYLNLLLADVSPHGQYGEYLDNGNVNPGIFPLSIYNENHKLSGALGAATGTELFWQKPKMSKDGTIYYHYYDENLGTQSKVELEDVVFNGNDIISSAPAIVNGSVGFYSYDIATNTYLTDPENLANVEDFISNFKPSWAYSLVCYHPEYGYYKTYAELAVEDGNGKSSDWFDELMASTNTWAEAVSVGFIATPSAPIVTNRLANFASSGSVVYDPFITSGLWTSYSTDVSNYQGTGKNIVEIAALMNRCPQIGSAASGICINFGNNASGTGTGGSTPQDIAARDADWQKFKGMYRSLKQEFIAKLAQQRAISNTNYLGYNGCIGEQNFNPFLNDFFNPLGSSQFLNMAQPCYIEVATLYKHKARRFTPPAPVVTNPNPYDSFLETAELHYEVTGHCPAFTSVSSMIGALTASDKLDGTGLHLNVDAPSAYTTYLLSQNLVGNSQPIPAAPDYTWNAVASGSDLDIAIKNGTTVIKQIELTQTTTPFIPWDDIEYFFNYQTTGTGGLGYQFSADFIFENDTFSIVGSTSIDIENCSFSESCELTSMGSTISYLMAALNDQIRSTSPLSIYNASTPTTYNPYITSELLNVLNPVTSPSTATWKYNSSLNRYELTGSGAPNTIHLAVTNVTPSGFSAYSNVGSFEVINIIDANTMVIEGYNSGGTAIVTITLDAFLYNGSSTSLAIADCEEPPFGCDDQAVTNVNDLKALLNDVLDNQTPDPNYDLYESSFLTSSLIDQFGPGITSASSTSNFTFVYNDGLAEGSYIISETADTVGMLVTITTLYNEVTASAIKTCSTVVVYNYESLEVISDVENCDVIDRNMTKITNLQFSIGDCDLTIDFPEHPTNGPETVAEVLNLTPVGEEDVAGNFYEFELEVRFDSEEIVTLKGSSCLPLRICTELEPLNPAIDSTTVIPATDPCVQFAILNALENAQNAYNDYLDAQLSAFRTNYLTHCFSGIESLSRRYTQGEFHHTLYYYDQAGNLIKTVPPEGVELLGITSSTDALAMSIVNDRTNGTHLVTTTHRMATNYVYNSLNQLVAQHMPDMDDMSSWNQQLTNGLDRNLVTTAVQMLDDQIGYLTGYVSNANAPSGTRGYLYHTTDGGDNWTRVNNLINFDLLDIEMASSSIGFAVGKSGLALRSLDNGATWDLLNIHSLGIVSDFVDVAFQSTTQAAFLLRDGRIVRYNSGTLSLVTPTHPSSYLLRSGNEILYNGSSNVYSVNADFRIGTAPDTLRFSEMATVNISTASPVLTIETTVGARWNAVDYLSGTSGFVGGVDGDIAWLNETNSAGTGDQYHQSSNIVGDIRDLAFLDKLNGVALIDDAGTKYFYRTTDGGKTWTKVLASVAYSMAVVKRDATTLNVVLSISTGRVYHYALTSSSITNLWIVNESLPYQAISVNDSSGLYQFVGLNTSNVIRASARFNPTSTTIPTVKQFNASYTGSGTLYGMKSMQVDTRKHVLISQGGTVYDISGTWSGSAYSATVVNIGSAGKDFRGIEVGKTVFISTIYYVIAYDHTARGINKANLGTSAPSAGALAPFTGTPTTPLPSTVVLTGMGVHNDFVTMVGDNGAIYSTTITINALTATNAVVNWVNRSALRIKPIKSVKRYTFTNSSVSYNALAVGHFGVALKRTSTSWSVTPLGITASMGDVFHFSAVDAETISSQAIAYVSGQGDVLHRVKLASFTVDKIKTNTLGLATNIDFRDVELFYNTSSLKYMAHAVAGNGNIYYAAIPNPASGQVDMTTTFYAGEELNAICSSGSSTSNTHWVAGNKTNIWYGSSTAFTRNYSIFGSRLNDVHFANANVGTVAGDIFFVRSTVAGINNWSAVLPSTISSTWLTKNVTDVVTKTTVAPAVVGGHFAYLGGVGYSGRVYNNIGTMAGEVGFITDLDLAKTTSHAFLCFSNSPNFIFRKVVLTPNAASGYTLGTATTITTSSVTANAIHVFDNDAVIAVGNSYVGYLAPSGSSFVSTNMPAGLPGGTYNDVVFTDDTHGYLVGNNGIFYQTSAVSQNNSSPYAITSISWAPRSVIDSEITSTTQVNLNTIDMYSATHGVWGGNFNSYPSGSYQAAVRTFDVENSLYSQRFYYDRLGRIVVSKNTRQNAENKYSYTLYDGLGRVVEAGEKSENPSGVQFASIFGTDVGGQYITSVIDDAKLSSWITNSSTTTRKEITRSYYDHTNSLIAANGLSTYHTFNGKTQRKRIVHVSYEAVYDGNNATYDHATHYDYDIHGNVVTLIQDNKLLGALTQLSSQRFKKLDYIFDLISGNVHRVDYQTGKADQWHHAYEYDADNRITDVYTTTSTPLFEAKYGMTKVIKEPTTTPYWEREAAYNYYLHGPLAKTTLGEQEVQGLDYVYNLQGWIKAVNSNTLDAARDPGRDGNNISTSKVARDVMGFSLHYFNGDYTPTGGNSTFIATQTGNGMLTNSNDLFNGNIARMVTTISNPNTRAVLPQASAYKYDQLNRLLASRSYDNINLSTNSWNSGGTVRYLNEFEYDANGNIDHQIRYNQAGTTVIDDLQYSYQESSPDKKVRNRLYHVDDAQTITTAFPDDIEDMGIFVSGTSINSANNYAYDAEGRLIKDVQEQIASIEWRVDGKVKAINRTSGSTRKNLKFDYDAMGHRIAKHVLSSSNALESSTYYILDAQGNTMATYEREFISGSTYFSEKERYIYGSTRLGVMTDSVPLYGSLGTAPYSQTIWNDTIGNRLYELSNHLGNVLSVISDKVIPHSTNGTTVDWFQADIRQSTDYSAFGVQLNERTLTLTAAAVTKKYRMGYQGSEMDNEVHPGSDGLATGDSYTTFFRQLDPRLGRWLSIDPKASSIPWQSPYCSMDNNPIFNCDPAGDIVKPKGLKKDKRYFDQLASELGAISGLSLYWKGGRLRYRTDKGEPHIQNSRPNYSLRAREYLIQIIDDEEVISKVKFNHKEVFGNNNLSWNDVQNDITGTNLSNNVIRINTEQTEYMQNNLQGGVPSTTPNGIAYDQIDKMTIGVGMVFLHEELHISGYLDPSDMPAATLGGVAMLPSTTDVRNSQFAGDVESILNVVRSELGKDWGQRVSYSMLTSNFIVIPFSRGAKIDIETGGNIYPQDPSVVIPLPSWYPTNNDTVYPDPTID